MIDVLVIGTGEYVTGLAGETVAKSDKSFGVVALSLFDMRARGLVGKIILAGRNGRRFNAIRNHFENNLKGAYPTLDVHFKAFPEEPVIDPQAYKTALKQLPKGSAVMIFTPDDTHFSIAKDALEAGMHVLIAKPLVKTVAEHDTLARISAQKGLLTMLEVHKRFDPIYTDAVDRIKRLGEFGHFSAYMSQPKSQLETFKAWAGISSDISYYLNAHHIDLLVWALQGIAEPVSVYAVAASGVGKEILQREIEDTITLTVTWKNIHSGNPATSIHTASWVAPPSDVHSQQRFFYLGHQGEIRVDQAHRGYTVATDSDGFQSVNPLFMKYTPRNGAFAGQEGYGYKSLEHFILSATALKNKETTLSELNQKLPTVANTRPVTAILEAGYRSLREKTPILLKNL